LKVTKIELIINLNTAKALKLKIPLPLLGRANEAIELGCATSLIGPTQTSRNVAFMSAIWGKADLFCSTRGFPSLTLSGHEVGISSVTVIIAAFCQDVQ